ncbi:uncharacterized protein LOC113494556 [Trichoplusia ni]|uniref:Uncharacterized protein LOC113494556 n=1 Tax=Trichoplusia ni TaxID=7111 RepID=A0A7E5VKE1_TRINI|nr:uncharacterized protein LOC113494556 [Trichoplusia ni]
MTMARLPTNSRIHCYFGCEEGGTLHHFPKPDCHKERFDAWKEVLHDAIKMKGDTYIYNQIRLCNKHFEKYYIGNGKILTRNAVPTLYTSLIPSGEACDTDNDAPSQEYSPPFLTEYQDELPSSITSKSGNDGFVENDDNSADKESQSLKQSTIILNKIKCVPETSINENRETCEIRIEWAEDSNPKRNKVEESCESVTDEKCSHCVLDKEMDKTNNYLRNLLIGELKSLPPCMRSHAYINILNYVDKLKQCNVLPTECEDPADLLLIFDKLFDSFNGHSYRDTAKILKGCLKNSSPHFQF